VDTEFVDQSTLGHALVDRGPRDEDAKVKAESGEAAPKPVKRARKPKVVDAEADVPSPS